MHDIFLAIVNMMMKTSLMVLHVLLMMQGLRMLMLVEGHMSFSHIHGAPHKAFKVIFNVLYWTHIPLLLPFFLAFHKVPILQTTIHSQIGNKFKSIPHTWHNTKASSITNYSHHFISYQKSQSTHKIYNTKSFLTFPTQEQSQTPISHQKKKKKTKENIQTKWVNTKPNTTNKPTNPQQLQPCLSSSSATCKLTRLKGDTNPEKREWPHCTLHLDILSSNKRRDRLWGRPRQAVSTKRKDLEPI